MSETPIQPESLVLCPGVVLPPSAVSVTFTRSGGPGGQNVNKLSTRATLTVPLEALARVMPADAVHRLRRLAGHRYAADPERLILTASDSRSQVANRRAAVQRLAELVERAMRKPKPRRPTKPSRSAIRKRLEQKKKRSQLKRTRSGNRGAKGFD